MGQARILYMHLVKNIFVAIAILFSFQYSPTSHAESSITINLSDLKKSMKETSLSVFEPHEKKKVEYVGYDTPKVLDTVLGAKWRDKEVILFVCADGYQSPVPTMKLLSYKSILAFKRNDKSEFSVTNGFKKGEITALSPMYLVWDNLKSQELQAEGAYHWPYQIVKMDSTNFKEKFPKLMPKSSLDQKVSAGAKSFLSYCVSCHKIHGEGGDIGGELVANGPVQKQTAEQLTKWILDPSSVKETSMPALGMDLKNRQEIAAQISAYLKSM